MMTSQRVNGSHRTLKHKKDDDRDDPDNDEDQREAAIISYGNAFA